MEKNFRKLFNCIGIVCAAVAGFFVIRSLFLCHSGDIWYDEWFTMALAARSLPECVALTASDVHPPLYYLIVMAGLRLGGLVAPAAMQDVTNAVMIAKLLSVLPFGILWVQGVTSLRKRFGWLSSGLFLMLVTTMPQLPEMTLEVRMYSWSLFFLVEMLLCAERLLEHFGGAGAAGGAGVSGMDAVDSGAGAAGVSGTDGDAGTGSSAAVSGTDVRDLAGLLIWGLAAMYTHYYACVGAACIDLIVLVRMCRMMRAAGKRTKAGASQADGTVRSDGAVQAGDVAGGPSVCLKDFGWLFLIGNLTLVGYLPWLVQVVGQVKQVKTSYWIQPLSWRTPFGCLKTMYLLELQHPMLGYLLAGLMILATAAVLGWQICENRNVAKADRAGAIAGDENGDSEALGSGLYDARRSLPWHGVLVLLGLLAFGFIASALLRPVFVYRYLVPALGVFWLGVAVAVGNMAERVMITLGRTAKTSTAVTDSGNLVASKCASGLLVFVIAFSILFTGCGIRNAWGFRGAELYRNKEFAKTAEMLSEIPAGTKIICNFAQVQAISIYYLKYMEAAWADQNAPGAGTADGTAPYEFFLYGVASEPLLSKIYPEAQILEDPAKIREWIEAGDEVLFFGSFVSREDILQDWNETEGITNVDTGSFMLERYWIDVFELGL